MQKRLSSHNSYEYGRREFHEGQSESVAVGVSAVAVGAVCLGLYLAVHRYHIRPEQLVEAGIDAACFVGATVAVVWHLLTGKRRRQEARPHPPSRVTDEQHDRVILDMKKKCATLLGYDYNDIPWPWPDDIRRMQAIVLGMSGAGKTTLLFSLQLQDINRRFGSRRIPIIILDGKADKQTLPRLREALQKAGRLHQLRILDVSRPDISERYNPLNVEEDFYSEHVNFIFESFGLDKDFFSSHQKVYFNHLVRVLICAGRPINMYDIVVMAMDEGVLREQIRLAERRMKALRKVSRQEKRNFELSVASLLESLEDRARVEKIQGLLDQLSIFLEDKFSLITGAYQDLLSLDQVIEEELILYVPLNVNLYGDAAKALGKILLRNLQTLIGKYYEKEERPHNGRPLVSVFLDEFSPFAYPEFAHIIEQARGINAWFLFSIQSVCQLDTVSISFRKELTSAPNTIICMRTRDEDTAKYFQEASGKEVRKRRSLTVQRKGIFEDRYEEIGFGSETEIKEWRSEDENIKSLPQGQMEVLMTHKDFGTLYCQLVVRAHFLYQLPCYRARIYPHIGRPYSRSGGANLRFKKRGKNKSNSKKSDSGDKNPWL